MTPATAAVPELIVLTLALEQLIPSPTNPRKHFDEGRLDELAASMLTHGILQPLVVRRAKPSPHLTGGEFYEIVAGERRFRAAKRAHLAKVPAVLRELSDIQVLEAQLIENGQRDDIHPIEAADTFAALLKLDGSYNAKAIAAKIGKSERYVQNVLHYAVLVPEAKESFIGNEINAGHADLIARLKPADQKLALKACFDNLYGEDKERGCISVRQLNRWIQHNVRIDPVADAPQLPELQKLVEDKKGDTTAAMSTILQVSGLWNQTPATKGLLGPDAYHVVDGKKDTCGHMRRALVVIGDDRGKLVDICTARTSCKVHWKTQVEQLEREQKEKARPKAKGASGARPTRSAADLAAEKRARAADEKRVAAGKLRLAVLNAGVDRAKKAVAKLSDKALAAAMLKLLSWNAGTLDKYKSWIALADEELEQLAPRAAVQWGNDREYQAARVILAGFGVKLDAIEKELAAAAAPPRKPTFEGVRKHLRKQLGAPTSAKKRKAGKKR